MNRKDFFRIINEEISDFDFLGNDKYIKEKKEIALLYDEQFQKQFIIDTITAMRDKIKIASSDSSVTNDPEMRIDVQHTDMTVVSNLDVLYQYEEGKQPIKIDMSFNGDHISYTTDYRLEKGSNVQPDDFDSWYSSINWKDIDVTLFTPQGDEIEFIAFDNAPSKIRELFIRSYTESIIEQNTDVGEVKEKMPKYNSY